MHATNNQILNIPPGQDNIDRKTSLITCDIIVQKLKNVGDGGSGGEAPSFIISTRAGGHDPSFAIIVTNTMGFK